MRNGHKQGEEIFTWFSIIVALLLSLFLGVYVSGIISCKVVDYEGPTQTAPTGDQEPALGY